MNGIVISIDPVILRLGQFELRWYSLMILAGIAAAVMITVPRARKKGIAPDQIYYGVPWVVLGGIVGARLFYVIDHGEHFLANPTQVFGGAGAAIYGALAGGIVAAVVYAKIRHIPLGRAADSLAPGVLVGQMIGRVGCIINGDVWGRVTDLPWAFIYTHPNAMLPRELLGQPTHPYPAYEMIWNAFVLLGIWQLERRVKKDWILFLSYLSLYSLGRFILMFVREQRTWIWGLQQTQAVALLVLVIAVPAVIHLARRNERSEIAVS
jgi:phosphatidylglycerol---prolipoprotein diacylglyceryl transferase